MTPRPGRRSGTSGRILVKRVYAASEPADGTRVLVDRLWPRGLSKEKAGIDAWLKEIAPSDTLRQWFHHAPERWTEFQRRYREELSDKTASVEELLDLARRGTVTLLFGARDTDRNNAIVLQDFLRRRIAAVAKKKP